MAVSPQKLEDLVRWLNLVPYFSTHSDFSLMEAAQDLGINAKELRDVMQTLTCLGVGKFHGELFDMEVEYRGVNIIDDLGLNEPLRLTPTEASTYLLTLEALEEMPGLVDAEAVVSAAAKLRGIMDKKALAIYDSLAKPDPRHVELRSTISRALEEGVQIEIKYWSARSDKTSVRVVSPHSVFIREDDVYLRAWQDDIAQWRTFRVDRILDIQVLPEKSTAPALDPVLDADDPFGFTDPRRAELSVHPEFTWLAEHYDIDFGEPREDGFLTATMPIGSEEWFIRFALGQADRLTVIGPQTLVEAVARAARSAAASYTK
ncbi:hypothetical protein CPHO_06105 [Corynebacterium phocae]|uniref:WYL domain-containing protein n=1 Tax=Corynebacterium phocae TaxID=161895 RepID=A0A1L7D3E7_9CORY|nr:WYL domain-containing protein [Corynebacterium phocae]APT92531.1 hypothetical protein CPHO_06105 [Corynebacterium phocae]KAA8725134.1 WYL domain-containing protein [Corynebacterium phocae]